jgi:membrane protein
VKWRDVLLGAAVTTLLFLLGRSLIALYLAHGSATSTYGAAGSLVVLLLWVYYSAQIFLFGAEFTQVYANKYGTRLEPASNAVWRINHNAARAEYEEEAIQYHIVPPESPPETAERKPETAVPRWRHPVAVGLYGLAAGLLLGFLGSQVGGKK